MNYAEEGVQHQEQPPEQETRRWVANIRTTCPAEGDNAHPTAVDHKHVRKSDTTKVVKLLFGGPHPDVVAPSPASRTMNSDSQRPSAGRDQNQTMPAPATRPRHKNGSNSSTCSASSFKSAATGGPQGPLGSSWSSRERPGGQHGFATTSSNSDHAAVNVLGAGVARQSSTSGKTSLAGGVSASPAPARRLIRDTYPLKEQEEFDCKYKITDTEDEEDEETVLLASKWRDLPKKLASKRFLGRAPEGEQDDAGSYGQEENESGTRRSLLGQLFLNFATGKPENSTSTTSTSTSSHATDRHRGPQKGRKQHQRQQQSSTSATTCTSSSDRGDTGSSSKTTLVSVSNSTPPSTERSPRSSGTTASLKHPLDSGNDMWSLLSPRPCTSSRSLSKHGEDEVLFWHGDPLHVNSSDSTGPRGGVIWSRALYGVAKTLLVAALLLGGCLLVWKVANKWAQTSPSSSGQQQHKSVTTTEHPFFPFASSNWFPPSWSRTSEMKGEEKDQDKLDLHRAEDQELHLEDDDDQMNQQDKNYAKKQNDDFLAPSDEEETIKFPPGAPVVPPNDVLVREKSTSAGKNADDNEHDQVDQDKQTQIPNEEGSAVDTREGVDYAPPPRKKDENMDEDQQRGPREHVAPLWPFPAEQELGPAVSDFVRFGERQEDGSVPDRFADRGAPAALVPSGDGAEQDETPPQQQTERPRGEDEATRTATQPEERQFPAPPADRGDQAGWPAPPATELSWLKDDEAAQGGAASKNPHERAGGGRVFSPSALSSEQEGEEQRSPAGSRAGLPPDWWTGSGVAKTVSGTAPPSWWNDASPPPWFSANGRVLTPPAPAGGAAAAPWWNNDAAAPPPWWNDASPPPGWNAESGAPPPPWWNKGPPSPEEFRQWREESASRSSSATMKEAPSLVFPDEGENSQPGGRDVSDLTRDEHDPAGGDHHDDGAEAAGQLAPSWTNNEPAEQDETKLGSQDVVEPPREDVVPSKAGGLPDQEAVEGPQVEELQQPVRPWRPEDIESDEARQTQDGGGEELGEALRPPPADEAGAAAQEDEAGDEQREPGHLQPPVLEENLSKPPTDGSAPGDSDEGPAPSGAPPAEQEDGMNTGSGGQEGGDALVQPPEQPFLGEGEPPPSTTEAEQQQDGGKGGDGPAVPELPEGAWPRD
ncbi:unnamed protein product [Amoebophrya sp. A120]|nr:unnamed protein product [Amoebophrya sp. A120]|eukprot:GSA120T00009142001.1